MRLDLSLTAVDEQFYTVDEGGVVGGEEEHGLGDLLGLADTAGRNKAGEIGLCALGLVAITEQFIEARRVGDAGADCIHPDVAILQIEDPVAGKIADRRFRGGVDTERRRAGDAGGRRCQQAL